MKIKHPWGHMCGDIYSTVQWSVRSLKVDKQTPCAVLREQVDGIWYMWVFVYSLFSSYTVITQMRLTARLFPSSALPLSLYLFLPHCKSVISCIITCIIIVRSILLFQEVCFCLAGTACLSFSWTHMRTHRQYQRLMLGLVLSLFFCFVPVWCRPVLILERQQSRYSVHEETSGLLLGCHAFSLIIHSDITNLKSLKVCHREWGKNKMLYFFLAYYLKVSETVEEGDRRTNTDSSIVNLYLLIFWKFLKAHGWCQ